jgi:hypothetical protein
LSSPAFEIPPFSSIATAIAAPSMSLFIACTSILLKRERIISALRAHFPALVFDDL